MSIRDLHGDKQREHEADVVDSATRYARLQRANSKGLLARSRRHMAMMTCEAKLRVYVQKQLVPVAEERDYAFFAKPSMDQCINSSIVVMDGRPIINARMHSHYDKLVRIKKSMGKFGKDLLCVIGPRELLRDYSRGTYGMLYYFALDEQNPTERDPKIDVKGQPNPGLPILFNFADMAVVIDRWIAERKDYTAI